MAKRTIFKRPAWIDWLLPLPLAVSLFALEFNRPRLFFAAAVVALTVNEDVAIVMVGIAVLWWLRHHDWRTIVLTDSSLATAAALVDCSF